MDANVLPSNRSGACTVCPAERRVSAKATTPGVRPSAWWKSAISVIRKVCACASPLRQAQRARGLVAGEAGLALLLEGPEALREVRSASQLALGDVLLLDGCPQPNALVAQLGDHPLAGQERLGGAGCGVARLLAGELEQVIRWH